MSTELEKFVPMCDALATSSSSPIVLIRPISIMVRSWRNALCRCTSATSSVIAITSRAALLRRAAMSNPSLRKSRTSVDADDASGNNSPNNPSRSDRRLDRLSKMVVSTSPKAARALAIMDCCLSKPSCRIEMRSCASVRSPSTAARRPSWAVAIASASSSSAQMRACNARLLTSRTARSSVRSAFVSPITASS